LLLAGIGQDELYYGLALLTARAAKDLDSDLSWQLAANAAAAAT
jgi:hypothetical protein